MVGGFLTLRGFAKAGAWMEKFKQTSKKFLIIGKSSCEKLKVVDNLHKCMQTLHNHLQGIQKANHGRPPLDVISQML